MFEKEFIPGLKLCELFYHEAVRPILDRRYPSLVHSAAKLDRGSDVLGFDTLQSMDHHWGPKTVIYLAEKDCEELEKRIIATLANELPYEVHGYSTNFARPDVDGGSLEFIDHGPVTHGVTVTTVHDFFDDYLGVDPVAGLNEIDWLTIPQHSLRTVASGKIFHDGLKMLEPARVKLSWYPYDVWLYLLACQWRRIDQEEPFMARCGDVGDELGSRIQAMRMVDEIMKLCFLMEKQYAPYRKWFGTAFSQLDCAGELAPMFQAVFNSSDWKEREKHLSGAYLHIARMHNKLGITEPIEPKISGFHNRPYKVIHANRLVQALYSQIKSEKIRSMPKYVGAVSQFVDSTDVLDWKERCGQLRVIYE